MILNMEGRDDNFSKYNLSRFPQEELITIRNGENVKLFDMWEMRYSSDPSTVPGLDNIMRLRSLQPMLNRTLESTLGGYRKEKRNEVFCNLFEHIFQSGRDEIKKEISDFMKEHMDLFRQDIWKRKIFHQWLCDEGYVTASTYQKILDSVLPEERDVVIAWGAEHKIGERIEKARENLLKRPDLPLSEWRKRWHLDPVRDFNKKIKYYRLSDWHYTDSNLAVIPLKIGTIPVISANLDGLKCKTLVLEGDVALDYDKNKITVEVFDNRSSVYYSIDRMTSGYPATAVIPEGKTKIAPGAFHADNALEAIEGLDHVKNIGYDAFAFTSNLKGDLEIPASVEDIGANAFCGSGVTSFRVHDTLRVCGRGALASVAGVRIFCSPETAGVIGGGSRVCPEEQ